MLRIRSENHSVVSDSLWPMDCSPPASSVHGLLQARILEQVAISFSRESSQPKDQPRPPALQTDSLLTEPPGKWSEVAQLCLTLCDPMDCSLPGSSVHGILQARILSGLPFLSPGDLPNPGIEPRSPALQADTLTSEPPGKPIANKYTTKFPPKFSD